MAKAALKAGSTPVAFGDVVRLSKERSRDPEVDSFERYVGLEHLDPGDLKIRRWGNVSEGTTFTNVFRPGQVLFGKRRAYQRKVAVADFSGVCSGDIYVFEPMNEYLMPELLPFICQTDAFFEHAIGTSAGSLSPRTNWKSLATYEFALPPLEEQRRIACVLTASSDHGETLSRTVSSLEGLKRSAIDRLTHQPDAPEVQMGSLCSMQNGRAFPGSDYCKDGIRLLRPGNLNGSGYLTWEQGKTVCLPDSWEQEASIFVIEPGDVLINLTAQSLEEGFMGRVCLGRDGDRSLLNQRIGRFVDWSSDVIPEFLFRALQSSRFQRHAVSMCEGTKVKHLFWQHISQFRLRLPPHDQQRESVNVLRALDGILVQTRARCAQQHDLNSTLRERSLTLSGGSNRAEAVSR